jgi:predicted NAD/FAD-dependent oxidoreductase
VLHARHDWSAVHLEDPRTLPGVCSAHPLPSERSSLPVAYRWRYALALEMVGKSCLFDRALSMLHAATGAWAAGSKPHPCPAVPSPGAFSGPMA